MRVIVCMHVYACVQVCKRAFVHVHVNLCIRLFILACECVWWVFLFVCWSEVPNKYLPPECYALHESMQTLTAVITHLATQYAECQKKELKPQSKEERGKRMEDLLVATYLQVIARDRNMFAPVHRDPRCNSSSFESPSRCCVRATRSPSRSRPPPIAVSNFV